MSYCKIEECLNPVENKDTGLCASHSKEIRKLLLNEIKAKDKKKSPPAPIKKVSKKMSRQMSDYSREKAIWIEGMICPITGKDADQIHHKRGKAGYADQWALDNGVSLLMDKRFWLGVSFEGHRQIEDNPEWARKMGYSMPRQGQFDSDGKALPAFRILNTSTEL